AGDVVDTDARSKVADADAVERELILRVGSVKVIKRKNAKLGVLQDALLRTLFEAVDQLAFKGGHEGFILFIADSVPGFVERHRGCLLIENQVFADAGGTEERQ